MNIDDYKNNVKIIGSIIKFNRLKQNISQKKLSEGICVPSYLSRIENGELLASEDVLSILFDRLGLRFNDSSKFIKEGKEILELFFYKLNFNEFDDTNKIFKDIESKEDKFITSPLILDYYLAKLARYSSTPERLKFETSKDIIFSSFNLLSGNQKFIYNFYVGVDVLNISSDVKPNKKYIEEALTYKETGHCYYWLSFCYRLENNPIKAYDCIKKALNLYVSEGNIISIMSSYEKLAEVYFMLDNYTDAIHFLKISLNMAKKFKNIYFIEHLNSIIAWSYFRLKEYDLALNYLDQNTGIIEHRSIIPDSIIKSLIYFTQNDKKSLKKVLPSIKNKQTLEHISLPLANIFIKTFTFYIKNDDYIKSDIWEGLLIYIIDDINNFVELKKFFNNLLKDFYIQNRKYKDALALTKT